ncbi:MAG: 6-phosphofructokinase [Ruminococcus sp.]|uniref:6-phosphofructokinase n=1 Tax=unclassified Ruminococcus TaxID=2608920 RepID=UPI000339CA3E|nr:6-phosphofructokinase [Ruminococcus sp. CAG:330]CDE12454.1 phosphofructokinase [Ruminococcus sp. CAG:330]
MNIAVAQSGGPTCAINASLVGVFRESLKEPTIDAIFGSINGVEGIIHDHLIDLKTMILTNEDMELLRQTPSTVLGSCRYKLPDWQEDDAVYQQIVHCLKRRQIGAFFYIGGNDSMDTVQKLSSYFREKKLNIKVIGIPKTIDNDLCITDHTPGFGSAAKYVATTMQEIVRDSSVYSMPSITIVEIMGRHAGWLTASSAVLHAYGDPAPHLVYVPESHFSEKKFLRDAEQEMAKHKAVIVAVSEGVAVPEGVQSGAVDNFGHKYLSGIGKYLEQLVREKIGCKVRSIELNVMQRCSSHLCSKTDIDESEQIGAAGVQCALNGETGRVMVFRRIHDMPYTVVMEPADASQIANREKFLPREFLTPAGNNISDKAMPYFLPLIQGELNLQMHGGIPKHFTITESVLK